MAEQHPVGFQWVIEAKERGAKVIHVDPRFTRTSAMADLHVPIRAGTDIAFLGGIVNYIFEHDAWFEEYVRHYTNGPVIIKPEFRDTEDVDGLLLGLGSGAQRLRDRQLGLRRDRAARRRAGKSEQRGRRLGRAGARRARDEARRRRAARARRVDAARALRAPDPARATSRATRRSSSPRSAGARSEDFLEVAEALCENSGRERTSAIVYAVGWTQHTVGVQNIRAASIVQLLLGNIGRPGGGHPGAARPRQHPGLDRHPDAVQHPAGLHPDAAPAVAPDARHVRRAQRARHRRLGRPAAVHRLAAEGVVGRRGDRGERLLLRLPAAHQRRPLALRDDAEDARRRA